MTYLPGRFRFYTDGDGSDSGSFDGGFGRYVGVMGTFLIRVRERTYVFVFL